MTIANGKPLFGVETVAFDSGVDGDGQVRIGLWDRFTSWGEKIKDGKLSNFNEVTLGQFGDNWRARGDKLAMCFNHQSAYVPQNGQPAPALAFYDALVVVKDGKVIAAWSLPTSQADAAPFEPAARGDGMYGLRCEVTALGQDPREGLRNFKYISPMFTDDGRDEQGREIGYVLFDVAATNTPFQAGCEITFDGTGTPPPVDNQPLATSGGTKEPTMAARLGKMSKFVKFEDGADDKTIRQAVLSKMSSEAQKCAADEGYNYAAGADEFEEMAKAYEDSQYSDEDKDGDAPHVTMRKMASKFRRMAKMATDADGDKDGDKKPPTMDAKDGDADDKQAKAQMQAFAQRLGVTLPQNATRAQMMQAIDAAAVPASQLPSLVATQVEKALAAADQKRVQLDTIEKAKTLVGALEGYPEENKKALLAFASDPKTYEAAVAIAKPFIKAGAESTLFSRMTAGGNPVGLAADAARATSSGPAVGRRVYENALATFIVDDEAIAAKICEFADAKDGPMKMEIDAMLSESERDQPDARWIAADRLVRTKKHPEMWEATKHASLRMF